MANSRENSSSIGGREEEVLAEVLIVSHVVVAGLSGGSGLQSQSGPGVSAVEGGWFGWVLGEGLATTSGGGT